MVGIYWTRNMMGCRLSEEQMANIPYPLAELHLHVATKTVQSGAFLGTLFAGPITAAIKGERDEAGIKKWAEQCGKYGALVGLVAGPLMTHQVIKNATSEAIWDRSYRLRYNRNQVRVDRLSLVGAVAGCAAATYLGDSGTLGALVGLNGGMILAALFNATLA